MTKEAMGAPQRRESERFTPSPELLEEIARLKATEDYDDMKDLSLDMLRSIVDDLNGDQKKIAIYLMGVRSGEELQKNA
jgi:hypothetical protein